MHYEVSADCPYLAVCEAAEDIARSPHHSAPQETLGGLQLTKRVLALIVQRTGCNGPRYNTNGQLVCPNEVAALNARAMGATQWPQQQYSIPLSSLTKTAEIAEIEPPGQYL